MAFQVCAGSQNNGVSPSPEMIKEARRNPDGWVYQIVRSKRVRATFSSCKEPLVKGSDSVNAMWADIIEAQNWVRAT